MTADHSQVPILIRMVMLMRVLGMKYSNTFISAFAQYDVITSFYITFVHLPIELFTVFQIRIMVACLWGNLNACDKLLLHKN